MPDVDWAYANTNGIRFYFLLGGNANYKYNTDNPDWSYRFNSITGEEGYGGDLVAPDPQYYYAKLRQVLHI